VLLAKFIVRIIKKKTKQKNLKNMQFGQKRSKWKVVNQLGVGVKKLSVIKRKPSTLNWSNRKDALRASQELTRPHPWQAPGYKIIKSFERLSLEKTEHLGHTVHTGPH
jgi:hypothetical protein